MKGNPVTSITRGVAGIAEDSRAVAGLPELARNYGRATRISAHYLNLQDSLEVAAADVPSLWCAFHQFGHKLRRDDEFSGRFGTIRTDSGHNDDGAAGCRAVEAAHNGIVRRLAAVGFAEINIPSAIRWILRVLYICKVPHLHKVEAERFQQQ